jgi:hypothetical protein
MRHPCNKPASHKKHSKSKRKSTKQSKKYLNHSRTYQNHSPKRPDKKTRQQHHLNPLRSTPPNLHCQTHQTTTNPKTHKRKPPSRQEIDFKRTLIRYENRRRKSCHRNKVANMLPHTHPIHTNIVPC